MRQRSVAPTHNMQPRGLTLGAPGRHLAPATRVGWQARALRRYGPAREAARGGKNACEGRGEERQTGGGAGTRGGGWEAGPARPADGVRAGRARGGGQGRDEAERPESGVQWRGGRWLRPLPNCGTCRRGSRASPGSRGLLALGMGARAVAASAAGRAKLITRLQEGRRAGFCLVDLHWHSRGRLQGAAVARQADTVGSDTVRSQGSELNFYSKQETPARRTKAWCSQCHHMLQLFITLHALPCTVVAPSVGDPGIGGAGAGRRGPGRRRAVCRQRSSVAKQRHSGWACRWVRRQRARAA